MDFEEALKAKELCDAAGIEIFGLTTYLAVGDTEKLVNVMEAANAIGCGQVRAGLVPYDPAKAEAPYPVLFSLPPEPHSLPSFPTSSQCLILSSSPTPSPFRVMS